MSQLSQNSGKAMRIVNSKVLLISASLLFLLSSCSRNEVHRYVFSQAQMSAFASRGSFAQMFEQVDSVTLHSDRDSLIGTVDAVGFLKNGKIVVADNSGHQVLLFSGDGTLSKVVGAYGKGPGEHVRVVSIAAQSSGGFLTLDNSLRMVSAFDSDGVFLYSFKVSFGYRLAVAGDSGLYVYNMVAPVGSDAVAQYGPNGARQRSFYPIPSSAVVDRIPIGLGGIACDRKGDVFVVHGSKYRVEKFSSDGKLLMNIGREAPFYKALEGPITPPDMSKINSFTPVSGLFVLRNGILIVLLSRNEPRSTWLELYDTNGNFLAGGIQPPATLSSMVGVSGDVLYFLEQLPGHLDKTGQLPNPCLVGYRVKM